MKLFQNTKFFISLLATLSHISLLPIVSSYDEMCDEETGLCSVSPYLNPTDLLKAYPDILSDDPTENKSILCPFVRLAERYGLFGDNDSMPNHVSIPKGLSAVKLLGTVPSMKVFGSGVLVSVSQSFNFVSFPGFVNIEALHLSALAHDCGIQFAKGATAIDDETRNSTLSKLAELTDDDGHLSLDDIAEVKNSICYERGVEFTYFGELEMSLLYTFLGGAVRGYVEYSDVERFLYTKLPMMIGESGEIDFPELSDA